MLFGPVWTSLSQWLIINLQLAAFSFTAAAQWVDIILSYVAHATSEDSIADATEPLVEYTLDRLLANHWANTETQTNTTLTLIKHLTNMQAGAGTEGIYKFHTERSWPTSRSELRATALQ